MKTSKYGVGGQKGELTVGRNEKNREGEGFSRGRSDENEQKLTVRDGHSDG